jgi:hypothetical protein
MKPDIPITNPKRVYVSARDTDIRKTRDWPEPIFPPDPRASLTTYGLREVNARPLHLVESNGVKNMITIVYKTCRFTCLPKNAEKVREAIAKLDKRKTVSRKAARKAPNRVFPFFSSGMTGDEYIAWFTHEDRMKPCAFVPLPRPSPEYDPSIPMCLEELET